MRLGLDLAGRLGLGLQLEWEKEEEEQDDGAHEVPRHGGPLEVAVEMAFSKAKSVPRVRDAKSLWDNDPARSAWPPT